MLCTRHCTDIVKKAYFVLRNVINTFKRNDTEFYVKLCTTYVRPILEYASQVWSPVLNLTLIVWKAFRDISLGVYYTGKIYTI